MVGLIWWGVNTHSRVAARAGATEWHVTAAMFSTDTYVQGANAIGPQLPKICPSA